MTHVPDSEIHAVVKKAVPVTIVAGPEATGKRALIVAALQTLVRAWVTAGARMQRSDARARISEVLAPCGLTTEHDIIHWVLLDWLEEHLVVASSARPVIAVVDGNPLTYSSLSAASVHVTPITIRYEAEDGTPTTIEITVDRRLSGSPAWTGFTAKGLPILLAFYEHLSSWVVLLD